MRGYPEEKKTGLVERSRRPHMSPRATRPRIRFQLKQEVGKHKSAAGAQDSAGRRAVPRQEEAGGEEKGLTGGKETAPSL